MVKKICLKCKKECGPRSLKCPECGVDFNVKRKNKLSNSDGEWATDKIRGLPDIGDTEELPEGLLTIKQVREFVSYEGLYAFDMLYADKIKDKELSKRWEQAKYSITLMREYLYD